ncbi:MAG: VCBS repeat-containing protein, partial [Verrucomicrobiota bacterium]
MRAWACLVGCVAWWWASHLAAGEWRARPWGRERPLEALAGTESKPGFARMEPTATGITFSNRLSLERQTTNQIYLNGSGVALGDMDGDGRPDVFMAGLGGGSALYRNLGGWRFEDVSLASGSPAAGLDATGAAFVDVEGDGDLDLIVNSVGGGTVLHRNDGKGRFAKAALLNPGKGGMSLALADYDGDGFLDLYVANYRTVTLRDQPQTQFRVVPVNGVPTITAVNGRPTTDPDLEGRFTYSPAGGIAEHGEQDALYRNDGRGSFAHVGPEAGVFLDAEGRPDTAPRQDWGLSVMFRDFTGDGRPDLYVCNDFDSVDRIWIHDGKGRFRPATPREFRNTSKFSMGVDVADIDRDGRDDVFVLDMLSRSHAVRLTRMDKGMEPTPPGQPMHRVQVGRNTLQWARPDGTFAEVAWFAGLAATEWSWTPMFLDVDLDGFEDLLVTAGHGRDDMDLDQGLALQALRRTQRMTPADHLAMRKSTPALTAPRQLYRNLGGARFTEVGR